MKISKILNNNFVIVQEDKEMVVMGIGIGFNKRVGDEIHDYEIEKTFHLSNSELNDRLYDILVDVPLNVFKLSECIIASIRLELGKKVNEIIYVTLTDHINSALSRYKEGISIPNNLLLEIQKFYPQEYQLGYEALKKINETLNVDLKEDEAGFIAMHIVNSTISDEDNIIAMRITELIKQILAIVRRFFNLEFDNQSVYYYRFVTHLKFFGQRLFTEKLTEKPEDLNDLMPMLISKYQKSYECSQLISNFLEKSYHVNISNEEIMYLTIHIQRMVNEHHQKERNHE
ncbi:MAG: PRD domain-containing protein [Erysipelothrix sp.]|nr:PRD domain-containing protein [Erysipelothrix sp.]